MKDLNSPELLAHIPVVTIYPDNALAKSKSGVKDGREWTIREQTAFLNTGKRYPIEFILIIDRDKAPYPAGNYLLSASSFGVGDFNSLRFDSRGLVLIPIDDAKKA